MTTSFDPNAATASGPVLTIGIPTYNRARFLRESLDCAFKQTYPNIEVIVSDNASTDETARVVEEIGKGRVVYHRQASNLGPAPNFAKTVELARGDYFCWLQDDDLLFHDFAARAMSALGQSDEAVAYLAYTLYTPSIRLLHAPPGLFGPPFVLDWASGAARVLPGSLITPLSLLLSVAIPPTIVFQTHRLKEYLAYFFDNSLQVFVERTLLAALARDANVLVGPHIAGVYRRHELQLSVSEIYHKKVYAPQWQRMAEVLEELASVVSREDAEILAETLRALPTDVLANWVEQSNQWPSHNKLAKSMRALLHRAAKDRGLSVVEPGRVVKIGKELLRGLCPPLLWRGARRLMGRPALN